jgi:hypothetical protein
MYQRGVVGARRILIFTPNVAEKSFYMLAMWAQRRPMISTDG